MRDLRCLCYARQISDNERFERIAMNFSESIVCALRETKASVNRRNAGLLDERESA